jgi:hypothetical protein
MSKKELLSNVKDSNPKDAVGIKKVPYHLVPSNVIGELSLAFLEGARKYKAYNWRVAGVRASVYLDALERHLKAWENGEDLDPDSGLSHITKALACLVVLRDAMLLDKWVDDRPPKVKQGWVQELNKKAKEIIERYPEELEPYTEIGQNKNNGKTTSTKNS